MAVAILGIAILELYHYTYTIVTCYPMTLISMLHFVFLFVLGFRCKVYEMDIARAG